MLDVQICLFSENNPAIISDSFSGIGWGKPVTQYEQYLAEQAAGSRVCFVATANNQFAGYVTVNWAPIYHEFVRLKIPEIQDLNVLPAFRRRGIGTRLLDRAEEEIALRGSIAGIGVGLHPGYNEAQRLYVKRGYIPDGCGVTYRNIYVGEGVQVVLDDDLVLHLCKCLDAVDDDGLDSC